MKPIPPDFLGFVLSTVSFDALLLIVSVEAEFFIFSLDGELLIFSFEDRLEDVDPVSLEESAILTVNKLLPDGEREREEPKD